MTDDDLGARSFAGDIVLHPDFGYMHYAWCRTEAAAKERRSKLKFAKN